MDAIKKIEDMLPLPVKARKFLCSKCMSDECTPDTAQDAHPLCARCGYLGFGGDVPLTDEQIQSYAREYAAQTLASKEAELVRLKAATAELLAAYEAPYPKFEEGAVAQEAWSMRRENAVDAVRALTQPTE